MTIAVTLRAHPNGLTLEELSETIKTTSRNPEVVRELCSPDGMLNDLLTHGVYSVKKRADGKYYFSIVPGEKPQGVINENVAIMFEIERQRYSKK